MNFNKKDDEKPTLAAGSFAKKTSGFSVNNLGKTSASFFERLKNLSRKDMAIVGMGLSILVMAPIAEFMMTKPSSDNLLTPGFGERKGSDSGMPNLYDSGVNALSAGSPDGSGEVIVPLTARDPSSLIVGAQSAPPPAPVLPPSNFRDSMRDVAPKAFSEAVKSAPAPFTPSSRLASSLRGMGSFFSGGESSRTSGNLGGGKILADAQSVSKKSEKRSMAGPVAIPGYKGVASNTPNSASKGALEKLRGQADKAAGFFSGDNAVKALQDAAAASVKGEGNGALGGVSDSEKIKPASGSNTRNSGSYSPGDPCRGSLATQLACEDAKSWAQFKRQMKQDLFKGLVESVTKPISQKISDSISGLLNPYSPPKPIGYCKFPNGSSVALYGGKNKDNNPTTSPMSIGECISAGGQFVTSNGGGSNSGGAPNAGAAGDSSSVITPAILDDLQKSIDSYDSSLKQAVEAFAESKGKDKDDMKSGAGFLTQVFGTGKNIARTINSLTSSQVGTVVASYNEEIGKVEGKIKTETLAVQEFNRKLQAALEKAKKGERISTVRTKEGTAEVDRAGGNDELAPKLEKMLSESRVIESSFTARLNDMQYHRNAVNFYNSQKSRIFAAASQLGTGYETKASEMATYSSQIEQGQELGKIYEKIVGISTQGAVSQGDSPVKFAFISRGILPDEYKPDNMLKEHFDGEKVKDKKARDEEASLTSNMPYAQLFTGQKAPRESEVKSSIVSASVRALISLPKDVDGMRDKLKEVDSEVAVLKGQIEGFKSQLKSMGIEGFDDAAVNPAGNNSGNNSGNNAGNNSGNNTGNNAGNNSGNNSGNNAGNNSGTVTANAYDLSGDMRVVDNSLQQSENRLSAAQRANNCTSANCKSQMAGAIKAIEGMRTAQRNMTSLRVKMESAKTEEEKKAIRSQFDEEKRKFEDAQKKFDGKGMRTSSDGVDKVCGSDINMSCVEKRIGITSRPHSTANNTGNNSGNNAGNNSGNNSGNNTGNNTGNNAGNNSGNNSSSAANQSKDKKCYETKEGCSTVSSMYVARRWVLKKRSDIWSLPGYEEPTFSALEKTPGKQYNTATRNSICHSIWAGKLINREDSCRTRLFREIFVLEYTNGLIYPSQAPEEIDTNPLQRIGNGDVEKIYSGMLNNVFDIGLKLYCKYDGKNWIISNVSMMVRKSVATSDSFNVNVSVGPSWGKIGGGYTHGTTTTIPYSEGWNQIPGMAGAICGNPSRDK